MSRIVTVAAAQSGPVDRNVSRSEMVERLLVQIRQAHDAGCQLVRRRQFSRHFRFRHGDLKGIQKPFPFAFFHTTGSIIMRDGP